MSHVTLIGMTGLVATAACWALAVLLYRVSTTGTVARKLSILLVIEGVVLVTAGFPQFFFDVPDSFYELHPTIEFLRLLIHIVGDTSMLALYPPFLALALNTSLTRPFAGTRSRIGLAIGTTPASTILEIPNSICSASTLSYLATTAIRRTRSKT